MNEPVRPGSWPTPQADDLPEPHPSRLAPTHPHRVEILARHAAAVRAGTPCYPDPVTGFAVFTARFLADRAYCCESGCRHCPYLP